MANDLPSAPGGRSAPDLLSDLARGMSDLFGTATPEDAPPAPRPQSVARASATTPTSTWTIPVLPPADEITMITAHLFKNAPEPKNQEYALALQLFTVSTPFTPDKKIAAWAGAVGVMRNQNAFDSWLRGQGAKSQATMTAEQIDRVQQANDAFQILPKRGDFPRMGLPLIKKGGTKIEWDLLCRIHQSDTDDYVVTLHMPGNTFDIELMPIHQAKGAKPNAPKFWGYDDPRGLYVSKSRKER